MSIVCTVVMLVCEYGRRKRDVWVKKSGDITLLLLRSIGDSIGSGCLSLCILAEKRRERAAGVLRKDSVTPPSVRRLMYLLFAGAFDARKKGTASCATLLALAIAALHIAPLFLILLAYCERSINKVECHCCTDIRRLQLHWALFRSCHSGRDYCSVRQS